MKESERLVCGLVNLHSFLCVYESYGHSYGCADVLHGNSGVYSMFVTVRVYVFSLKDIGLCV